MISDLNDANFDSTIAESPLIIIDFWSPWCGPCNKLNPILYSLAEKNPDVPIGKLNAVENSNVTQKFGVSAVPTIIFFKEGKIAKRLLGYYTEAQLQAVVDELK